MASVYTLIPIDLTAPSTSIGTVTPPAIIVSTLFKSANSGNIPFVAQPTGTGAFQLQPTDSTATGGNARGANAVDLQTIRSAATQVASGINSFVVGQSNTASASTSVALGQGNLASNTSSVALGISNTASGFSSLCSGQSNTASANWSTAIGYTNNASGASSVARGSYSSTKGISSFFALGNDIANNVAKAQTAILGLGVITTDAIATVLKSDIGAAAATNQFVLQDNSSITFTGLITATTTTGGNCSSWEFKGMIQRGVGAATTALVAAVTPVLIARKAGAAGWVVAVAADTTLGCLNVTVTGQAATTIRWNCSIFSTEVAF